MRGRPLILILIAAASPAAARAQAAPAAEGAAGEVVVTADRAGLLDRRAGDVVFGLGLPLEKLPRSATAVGDVTLERYAVRTVDQLVEISPSTYTASFYGVPGSLNVRGTLAEDYFEGFKRVENRGTYATPLGDAAGIEVVRGPPDPSLGPGKVGGLLNVTPKSARGAEGFLSRPFGSADLGLGSYDYRDLQLEGGAPLALGGRRGGVYGYLDAEDSGSFYRGLHPRRETLQASGDFDLAERLRLRVDAMVHHAEGEVQTAGWNRLTQRLIDSGAYQGGRNASLLDLNGDGRIEANEPGAYPYGGLYGQLVCYYAGCTNAVHQLTQNVGPAHLSPRTVDVGPSDFSNTTTYTAYARLEDRVSAATTLRLESFYDALENERFVSYGFPASYQTYVLEERLSLASRFAPEGGALDVRWRAGLSTRYADAHLRESFNSGIIALDRRDLSAGPSPGDVIASPFETAGGTPGWPWEIDVHSNIRQWGGFAVADIGILGRADLVLGAREDAYNVSSGDRGVLSYEAGGVTFAHAARTRGSWTASLSVEGPFGLRPYYAFDRGEALELDQAGDLLPGVIGAGGRGGWLSASYLSEAGVKARALGGRLTGSLAAYRQTRTQLIAGPQTSAIQGTLSRGVEVEARLVLTPRLSLTYAGNVQRTEVKGPDASFVYLPPAAFGVPGTAGYGGSYAATVSTLPGRAGDYELAIIPHAVNSLYATYTSDAHPWGRAGATFGATHVSKTSMIIQGGVVYPAYWLASLSGFWERGPTRISLSVENLADARYFTPNADPTYENVAALPGVGRSARVRLRRLF